MAMIRITPFSGLIPKNSERLLPDGSATVANNVKLTSGEIKPLNGLFTINKPNKTLPALSIYLARNSLDASAWFTWPIDVDVVRAPLSVDVESRFYWTGDGAPKYTTYKDAVSSGNNDYPYLAYDLGVPAPQTKPTVAAVGGAGTVVSRFYVYTYFSALGEESAPSPVSDFITGKVDSSWNISNMDELPASSGSGTAAYASGFTTFTNGSSARHWLRVGESVVLNGDTLTVTAIPNAYTFKVAGDYHTAIIWTRKNAWNTTGMKRRLYRTAGNNATFQLVADDVPATYTDTLTDAQILGDEIISNGWAPPPVNLKNIMVHPSGALIGIAGNLLCFSEPYQPHAWPESYQLSTDYAGVGLGIFGTEIGVATEGNPYIASGVDPASMSMNKVDGVYPCLSKRSVISVGDGFMYATTHGYVSIGSNGVNMFTDQFYTKDEWKLLNPETMVATAAYGRIYLAYSLSDTERYMLIMENGLLLTSDIFCDELYTDVATGEMYVSNIDGVNEWDSDNAFKLNSNWRSKDYVLPDPVNMGAAKIDFELAISEKDLAKLIAERDRVLASNAVILASGKSNGEFNATRFNRLAVNLSDMLDVTSVDISNKITFILRKGDDVVTSRVIGSDKAFKLPAGYKADVFSIEVLSQCKIKEIRVAETMDELRAA